MTHSVEKLRAAGRQTEQMGRSMALAFRQEPNFTYMLPGHSDRERPLTWFFGSFVARIGLRHGEVYTTPGGRGGAVWIRPGARVSPWDALRAGLLTMPRHLGLRGTRRSIALGGHIEQFRQELAPPSHWYLTALGVRPAQQGRGLGGALLEPLLARADADGTPCYLETFRERTAAFYRRAGFDVARTATIPRGGPSFWCMIREPQN